MFTACCCCCCLFVCLSWIHPLLVLPTSKHAPCNPPSTAAGSYITHPQTAGHFLSTTTGTVNKLPLSNLASLSIAVFIRPGHLQTCGQFCVMVRAFLVCVFHGHNMRMRGNIWGRDGGGREGGAHYPSHPKHGHDTCLSMSECILST